jgi:hypothetical protein
MDQVWQSIDFIPLVKLDAITLYMSTSIRMGIILSTSSRSFKEKGYAHFVIRNSDF